MLNYSEFGTEVNGQWYTCDFTEHPASPPRSAQIKDPMTLYDNIRSIIDKRRNIVRAEVKNGEVPRFVDIHLSNVPGEKNFILYRISLPNPPKCECNTRAPMINGWEGTAVLTHGSLIRFGCVSYVFSIVVSNFADEEF